MAAGRVEFHGIVMPLRPRGKHEHRSPPGAAMSLMVPHRPLRGDVDAGALALQVGAADAKRQRARLMPAFPKLARPAKVGAASFIAGHLEPSLGSEFVGEVE